jgi:hypothetical protein
VDKSISLRCSCFILSNLIKIINKITMGRPYCTCGRNKKLIHSLCWKTSNDETLM